MNLSTRFITIVIPAYNVERYIGECLDSLINQDEQDFEVIVVDDGSKDSTGRIADFYAQQYSDRIRVIHKENGGLGQARNRGMQLVTTPYIAFLDSDDWYFPGTIRNIKRRMQNEVGEPDIMFMKPKVYNMSTHQFEEWRDNQLLEQIFLGVNVSSAQQDPRLYGLEASICRCVFRTEFLRQHTFAFQEGVKWEDVFPHFYLFYWAKRCIMVEGAGFCYRINSGSQTTALITTARYDLIPVFSSTLAYAIEHKWGEYEIAYIMDMMFDFIRWFLEASTKEVQMNLVEKVHVMIVCIPKRFYKIYCRKLNPSNKRKLLWRLLRSPLSYKLLKKNHNIETGKRIYDKIKAYKNRW